jgi:two-component system, NtrC family, response regulator AtoC
MLMTTAVQQAIRQRRRALVVDDSPRMLDVLCEMIVDEGYDITRAPGGEAALEALSSGCFELVITDLYIGRVSGVDVLRRAKELCPGTVVIIITGNTSITPAIEAVRYGVDGYLLKPFNMIDLLESISHCFYKRSLMNL